MPEPLATNTKGAFGLPFFCNSRQRGFTIVEITVVLVLIGIVSIFAAPRFAGVSAYKLASVKAELISLGRYAQESALNQSDTLNSADPTGPMVKVRVQLVFEPDPADPLQSEIRVEVGEPGAACAALGNSVTLRSIPMQEGISYPTGSVLFGPLAALESPPAYTCLDTNAPEMDLNGDGTTDLCIEPSGYVHEGDCYL